jgi:hypothetical protein
VKIFALNGLGIHAAGAALLLAGCNASQQQLPTPSLANTSAIRGFSGVGSWIAPNTSGQNLIYMAEGNEVAINTLSFKQVGALKGLQGAQGLCSDSHGNVWVTYGVSLLEYAHAGTIPIAQIYTPSAPFSCAVDPSTGDIAVTEEGNVAVFQYVYGTPQTYTDPDLDFYDYCSYDDQGNLFVNGAKGRNHFPLAELPSGGSSLQTTTLDKKIGRAGGLQWDGQYLALGDSLNHVVYQISVSGGQGTTQSTTRFKGWSGSFKTMEPFAIYNGEIVLTFSKRQTGAYQFPAGGDSIRRISVVTGAKTISVASSGLRRR